MLKMLTNIVDPNTNQTKKLQTHTHTLEQEKKQMMDVFVSFYPFSFTRLDCMLSFCRCVLCTRHFHLNDDKNT